MESKHVSQEQLSELMGVMKVGDCVVFDERNGVFKIIKLEKKAR